MAPTMTLGREISDWSVEDLLVLMQMSPVQAALAQVEQALRVLPLPPDVAAQVLALLTSAAAHEAADDPETAGVTLPSEQSCSSADLLAAVEAARGVQGFADAVVVSAARSLAERAGRELLQRTGLTDPGELSRTARERWRAQTKSVVANELATLTGWSLQSCHDRVAFALAPRAAVAVAEAALERGATQWRGLSEWWRQCRTMKVEEAAEVGRAVFGPLLPDPLLQEDSAEDPAPQSTRHESWPEFQRRLNREVVRVQGSDPERARARRRAAVERRNAWADIVDDGLSQLGVSGPTASIAAAIDRIETIARRARRAGDDRPLAHLRADTALALLVHGVLPLPGHGECGSRQDPPVAGEQTPDVADRSPVAAELPQVAAEQSPEPVPDQVAAASERLRRIITGQPPVSVEIIVPLEVLAGTHASTVAEVPGHGFLSAEHARELILTPGTMLHRLLTDPADGRLVERSIRAYRPDAAMTAQIRAADRFCRAPGCLVPADRCDRDHEQPHGEGGSTSEVNLNDKHPRHHWLKTMGFWSTTMDTTRAVTWTTLFGRIYRTRGHDYRQYESAPNPGPLEEALTVNDPDLCDQLVYAALSSRVGRDCWLEALDDYDTGEWPGRHQLPLDVFHRVGGRKRPGPPPGQPCPEELLAATDPDSTAAVPAGDPEELPPEDEAPPF